MPRDRQRIHLEAGPKIDLRKLPMKANRAFRTTWSWSSGLEAEILVRLADRHGTMLLRHGEREQVIDLIGQPRHYGGVQWYALCPRTGGHVLTLWKPPGSPIFASRYAWPRQVAYGSQFQDPTTRAWQAMRRVARRLGSTNPDDYELPDKPKGMHWSTYDRWSQRHEDAEARLDDMFARAAFRLMNKYPSLFSGKG